MADDKKITAKHVLSKIREVKSSKDTSIKRPTPKPIREGGKTPPKTYREGVRTPPSQKNSAPTPPTNPPPKRKPKND